MQEPLFPNCCTTCAQMIRPAFAIAVTVLYQGCSFLHFITYAYMNLTTLDPAYNEFAYNEHPDTKSKKFSIELTSSH